jgi:quercetin dioxygenase-like cupin family protein
VATFDEIASIAPQEIWEGVLARPVHGDNVTLALIELAPNSHVPDHRHVNEQVGVLVRGSFRLRIGEETREIEPGGAWRIPAGAPHEAHVGPDGALAVEVWSPPREDWEQVERQEPRSPGWPD